MRPLHRRQALAWLGTLACPPRLQAQTTPQPLGAAHFPPTTQVEEHALVLNGAGIRYKAMFQVYAAALYLEHPMTTTESVFQATGAKRIAATMLRTINASELGSLFTSGMLDNNPPQLTTLLLPNIARMSAVFSRFRQLVPGEQFTVDRIPGKGMVLTVKGEVQHEPFEDAFFDAMLNIWLGPKPADHQLKLALLGTTR